MNPSKLELRIYKKIKQNRLNQKFDFFELLNHIDKNIIVIYIFILNKKIKFNFFLLFKIMEIICGDDIGVVKKVNV